MIKITHLTLVSLFDGIGVFSLAAQSNGITPLWASEIEEAPIRITKKQFPTMVHLGDLTKLHGGEIPSVDVITFGSSCQNLSNIGNREGLAGSKSSYFMKQFVLLKSRKNTSTVDSKPVYGGIEMDQTISVYVTSLSQFEDDGLLISSWFTLPFSIEEVREKLQLEDDESYEIEDWESPFTLDQDKIIQALSQLALLLEENSQHPALPYLEELVTNGVFDSLLEGLENLNQIQQVTEKPVDNHLLERTYEMSDGSYMIT